MKKLVLLFTLFSVFAFGQNTFPTKFEVSKDGFTDFTVINVEGKTKEEIYQKTLEWINKTYNNPKEVIKAEVLNDYIRIEGIKTRIVNTKSSFLTPGVFFDMKYKIEISVKDNRYKFDLVSIDLSGENSYRWINIPDNYFYNKNGEINKIWDKESIEKIPQYLNTLNDDLKNYILSGQKGEKSDNW